MAAKEFYVYEHRRNDTNAVFYVGKGCGRRFVCTQNKTKYWNAVAKKHGWKAEIVYRAPDEEFAHLYEMELISRHRWFKSPLTNMTDGGEGMSGHRQSPETIAKRTASQTGQKRPLMSAKMKGIPKTAEHRKNLSLSKKGRKATEEQKLRMSMARKGIPSPMAGKKHTHESKEKISFALIGDKNPFYGKKLTPEHVEKLRSLSIGRKDSEETRLKKSLSKRGELSKNFGVPVPEERKLKQIATLKARPRVTCIHCGKTMDESNAKRWHQDNCRNR